jgi:hypothetical protein
VPGLRAISMSGTSGLCKHSTFKIEAFHFMFMKPRIIKHTETCQEIFQATEIATMDLIIICNEP